jgi:hypothetical protein
MRLAQKGRQLFQKIDKARKKSLVPTKWEEGAGLVEAAVGFLFLMLIMIVTFEMLFVFTAYISLLNASVQGAVYAGGQPDMEEGDPAYLHYESLIQAEALAGGLSWKDIVVNLPEVAANSETGIDELTVSIDYHLTTPFGEIFFPLLGKFGLPSTYHIVASTTVPVREGP